MEKKIETIDDITSYDEFPAFYESKGLKTLKEKIEYLKKELGVLCTHESGIWTDEERLLSYEEEVIEKLYIPLSGRGK